MDFVKKVAGILDLIKIENAIFVLPFVYIGMLYATGLTFYKFILITIALLCARGAGFTMNRYFGRKLDTKNPKKKNWVSVKLFSENELLALFAFFVIVFLVVAHSLNFFALILAPIIIILVIAEPQAKRFTEHRHFIMGFVIGLGILGGYIGVAGDLPRTLPLYVLLAGYTFFAGANDIIYTLNHVQFDRQNKLKTYPAKFGVEGAIKYSYASHNIAVLLFVLFGWLSGSIEIVLGALIAGVIVQLEHQYLDFKKKNTLQVSFFNYNAAISLIMLLSVILFKFF
ncbi:MAG: UbiA-like polyprenyltransferase [Candidatus Micrarchaeales archaeon]